MRAIVTAIVFFKQRTVCIINVWGCAEILPIPETAGEDCIGKVTEMIINDLKFRPTIENAHRSGARREDGSLRPILVKFLLTDLNV